MCGICGALTSNSGAIAAAVRRMMAAMVHRGPDDEGYEQVSLESTGTGPSLGLGFRRLSILDLTSAGHQPMVHRPTGDCLVFNGEIYNYRSLRSRLMAEGARFTSTGDSEVLLAALVRWGERALEEIEGMFAIAYYQASSRRVLLARDPVGIKPLYVATSPKQLVFASEVRALLASRLVSDELDPAGVAGFLAYGAPQDPLTVHRDIRSFPCGTSQWFGFEQASGQIVSQTARRFWHFPDVNPDYDKHSATEDLQATLETAVRSHLASDVKTGFFLSGGIDSTALAALATRATGKVATYSVGFESSSMPSELEAARATALLLGSDHTEIVIDARSVRSWWDRWLGAADRPSVDGLNSFIVSGAVKGAGATVAFSGLGADELFGGYATFRRLQCLAPVLRGISPIPRPIRRLAVSAILPLIPPRYRDRALSLASSNGRLRDLAVELKQLLSSPSVELLGLSAKNLGLGPDYLHTETYAGSELDSRDPFTVVSRVETYLYMGNTLLRDADITSMAHSLELRVPFVSRPVLELVGQVPSWLHIGCGKVTKPLLRNALQELIPKHVLQRAKTGFTLPVAEWMFSDLRDSCEEAVSSVASLPFIDASAVRSLWRTFVNQRDRHYWVKPMLLVALGSYLQRVKSRSSVN